MQNTGTMLYQITHPDLLTWISSNLILLGIVAVLVFLVYLHSTRDKSKDGETTSDDYTVTNANTGFKPMPSKEYYEKLRKGEFDNNQNKGS